MVVHFEFDGNTILTDSDEFKLQEDINEERKKKLKQIMKEHKIGNQKYIEYGEGEPTPMEEKEARRILRNKFNY
jgi:hypothetical protein